MHVKRRMIKNTNKRKENLYPKQNIHLKYPHKTCKGRTSLDRAGEGVCPVQVFKKRLEEQRHLINKCGKKYNKMDQMLGINFGCLYLCMWRMRTYKMN